MSVVVEQATIANAELIDAFNRLIPQLSTSNKPPTQEQLAEIIASPSTVLFIARHDEHIVGSLTLATFRIPTGVRAWIEDVVVDSAARGHGVGEALNQAAILEARHRGAITVELTSRPSREAANAFHSAAAYAPSSHDQLPVPLCLSRHRRVRLPLRASTRSGLGHQRCVQVRTWRVML